ncbi:MAG TPA: poly-beta-1,6-N-acetyl-D-glucosamine synthase [Stellaceae bacterium]|nr:poly-beta-1,6-N-acetyl-D-glucosamine synthase [Stellaceae bacterium]
MPGEHLLNAIIGAFTVIGLVFTAKASGFLLEFVFLYPLFMAYVWMAGGIYFDLHWERRSLRPDDMPEIDDPPLVSILVPCFNEADNAAETVAGLAAQNYPNFEIIAINDGSRDETGLILERLTAVHPNLRVIHHASNQGKAMALRMGALAARGEFLVCIDGDAVLHPNAVAHLVAPMVKHPRVGAVTGNPRIRTRSTLLGRIQVGEFSSIIGLIKRAQRVYGQVFTVSGVIAAFRRRALHRIGYWGLDMATEDIDVSWALEVDHWSIQYEPAAICWILMPETFKGLWRQRLRWARGGAEVFRKHARTIWTWRRRRMWAIALEYALSAAWAYAFVLSLALWGLGQFVRMPAGLNVPTILPPAFWGLMLASTNLIQVAVAVLIERRYEPRLARALAWIIWYPMVYWLISLVTTVVGFPMAFLRSRPARAVWTSPDRGFRSFPPSP